MLRSLPLLLLPLLVACGRTAPPSGGGGGAGASDRRAPASADAAVATISPDAGPPAPVDAAAPPAIADAGPAGARGEQCDADDECGWDDPCKARRCVGVDEPQQPSCDKSFPLPGTCTCVENQCTLRPDDPKPAASATGCTTDDACAVDVGAATCHLGGDTHIGPITQQGPVCTCNAATTRCEWSYVGPVACQTWRDCSWIRTPRLRPVPSKLLPRPFAKQVRACKDGEVDSVCTKAKVCEIVAWSC